MADHIPPLSQTPFFAEALRACGQFPLMKNGILHLQRRLFGMPLTMISRAHFDSSSVLESLPSGPIVLAPDHPTPWLTGTGALPLMTPASVAELDLTLTEQQLTSHQHQKWRNRLRKAQTAQLRVQHTPMPDTPNHWLYLADHSAQRHKGYRAWPLPLTQAFVRLGPKRSRLFTAYENSTAIAAMLFLCHGKVATYHIGQTTDRGRALNAHTLLLWQATQWLRAQGHSRLDLGLIDTRASPGLARFKLGSGATSRPLGGTWLYMPRLAPLLRPLARWDHNLMQST